MNKTVCELKQMCKKKGLTGYSKLNKTELVKLLKRKPKKQRGGAKSFLESMPRELENIVLGYKKDLDNIENVEKWLLDNLDPKSPTGNASLEILDTKSKIGSRFWKIKNKFDTGSYNNKNEIKKTPEFKKMLRLIQIKKWTLSEALEKVVLKGPVVIEDDYSGYDDDGKYDDTLQKFFKKDVTVKDLIKVVKMFVKEKIEEGSNSIFYEGFRETSKTETKNGTRYSVVKLVFGS